MSETGVSEALRWAMERMLSGEELGPVVVPVAYWRADIYRTKERIDAFVEITAQRTTRPKPDGYIWLRATIVTDRGECINAGSVSDIDRVPDEVNWIGGMLECLAYEAARRRREERFGRVAQNGGER